LNLGFEFKKDTYLWSSNPLEFLKNLLRFDRFSMFCAEKAKKNAAKLCIEPISETTEKKISTCFLEEINTNFGLNLDTEPDPMTMTGTGRVVIVGASHMSRTAAADAAAAAGGGKVIDATCRV